MKISVTVKPKSREVFVKELEKEHFVVAVKEPPEDGKANIAVVKALAEYFEIKPLQIEIVKGHTSRKKIIELPKVS